MKIISLLIISIFILNVAFTQCLPATNNLITQYNSNNGQRGCMFDITAINDVTITCLEANLYAGTTANYEIYYKLGTYVGSETNAGAWTLVGAATGVTSAGNNLPTPLPIPVNLPIIAGQTYGIYVTNDFGGGTSYTDGGAPGNLATDANINVFGGVGKSYPFGLTFSYRLFNGTINYVLGASPLPIELLEFTAKVNENRNVALCWSTSTETNNDYFILENSSDGVLWEQITKIDGGGTSTTKKEYNFIDQNPRQEISYYRLSQFDYDGTQNIVGTKAVKMLNSTTNENIIHVYPNPSNSITQIKISPDEKEGLEIYDFSGNLVSHVIPSEFENGVLTLDISSLSNGLYFLRSNSIYAKIVKN